MCRTNIITSFIKFHYKHYCAQFELTLYSCNLVQCRNFDHNNFSGTLNMTTWDQVYLIYGAFISMMYNDISTLDPSWEDGSKTYSPIL